MISPFHSPLWYHLHFLAPITFTHSIPGTPVSPLFLEFARLSCLCRSFPTKYQIFTLSSRFLLLFVKGRRLSPTFSTVQTVCCYIGPHGARNMKGNNICRNSEMFIVSYTNFVPFLWPQRIDLFFTVGWILC